MSAAEPLLELRGLDATAANEDEQLHALRGIDLEIGRGESLALVGESGCGKTMTALAMIGLPPPGVRSTGGELVFDGDSYDLSIPGASAGLRGKRIGFVFQDSMTSLNPVLTVGRQLTEPLTIHLGLSGSEARERALELLEEVGISDGPSRLKQYPHQLSGGQRQRLAIAIAIAAGPELLIADEPTTALDVTVQAQILLLLERERAARGMSLLLITHDLGVVASSADRVAVMYAGRVVESAPLAALLSEPRHPYTAALLRSVPRIDDQLGSGLLSIPGTPPELGRLPQGCPFEPRCPRSSDVCRGEDPPLEDAAGRRQVACWHAEVGVAS